ncbi:suppressor of fused domain protein [Saccharopolyspora sp. HNM0983]|uniref:Suppressor of fused domain protein n=1 Tax=Saccharopolyspora montiporae TaxID=2781240 RepID=A0A929B9K4_9PSEU|nr:suppressor of fused domain protein [Saccharopolyspora sp. HNM0983]MBE9374068.1 suppressor of fused domain protein [Saccharopolyspora sp. HNM0983]
MSRFGGFPAHVEAHIGAIRGADGRGAGGRQRAYHLVYCDHADDAHVSVLTSGLREHRAGAPLPQELVCTARSAQERWARHLVSVVAELLAESASRVGYGALVMNDRLLLPDTQVAGALAAPHPYLGDEFDIVPGPDGSPALQLITLIPLSRGEAQLVSRYGRDVLYDRWESAGADLRDLTRTPVA